MGQVDYVFSDKTGTLTCNKMDFKKFSVGKYSYGDDNRKIFKVWFLMLYIAQCKDLQERSVTNFNFEDEDFLQHYSDPNHPNYQNIHNFLLSLALCHTVRAD